MNNLKQIGIAMHIYAQVYGTFPPAYTTNREGRPLHSWRVLLLPYLEQKDLYDRLKLDEPWDSPYNRSVLQDDEAVRSYHCPSAESPKHETSYVMIVGPNTVSDGPHSVQFENITDGVSNTIMIVEVKDSHIHWAEPRDLAMEDMSFQINDPNGKGIGSHHPGKVNVAFADGLARFLEEDTPPNLLKSLITINGGEDVSAFIDQ